MRDFGKVHASFWSSRTILDAVKTGGEDVRVLALYLLTGPHSTSCGVFRLPDGYITEDLGWVSERLRNGFETLSVVEFAERCKTTNWVWICKFGLWNKPDNPNVRKAIEKTLLSVPTSVSFRDRMLDSWSLSRNGFGTVPKPQSTSPSTSLSPLIPEETSGIEGLPLDDGTMFEVDQALVAELTHAYPRVDLQAEFAKMRMWLLASPTNRKTRRGTPKFVNGWMNRAPERMSFSNGTASVPRTRRELGT